MVGCIEVADLATPQQGRNELPHRQAMCTIKNAFFTGNSSRNRYNSQVKLYSFVFV